MMNLILALLHINLFFTLKIMTRNFILVGAKGIFKFLMKDHYIVVIVPLSLDIVLIWKLEL